MPIRCWFSVRWRGDQRAYGLLVLKYQRRIQRLIRRFVQDADMVEDIAQETFIRAYKALHQFRGRAVLHLAVPHRRQYGQVPSGKQARDPLLAQAAPVSDEEDETSWKKNEPSTDEGPESLWPRKKLRRS